MSVSPGTHRLGPDNAKLSVRTERGGAAAAAGHDLVIRVTSWDAQLVIGDDSRAELDADGRSLRVIESTGGMQALGDEDRSNIHETIASDVLVLEQISFRSTEVDVEAGGRVHVEGNLTLVGETRPIAFDLVVGDDGSVSGSAVVKQTDWDMKPYSALFGALKVKDEVLVVLEGRLEPQSR
ncbi:MAG TPA: YceI family protein [Thermoleophilaceae bacterium]